MTTKSFLEFCEKAQLYTEQIGDKLIIRNNNRRIAKVSLSRQWADTSYISLDEIGFPKRAAILHGIVRYTQTPIDKRGELCEGV